MRKALAILALAVAGTVLSAEQSSAQGRRRGYYPAYTPAYTYPTYTPGYNYGTMSGMQIASPITTVSGSNVVYGEQPTYTPGYSVPNYSVPGYYNAPTYSSSGYYPAYNSGAYNSGYAPAYNLGAYNSGYNLGAYGTQYSNPALQLGSYIRSWVR